MDRQDICKLVGRLAKALQMRDYDQFLTPFAQDARFETPFGIEDQGPAFQPYTAKSFI